MGKDKDKRKSLNESQNGEEEKASEGLSYDDQMKYVSVIAKPMASEELAKKVLKHFAFSWVNVELIYRFKRARLRVKLLFTNR